MDHAALTERELMRTIIAPLAEAGFTRADVVEIAPFLLQFASDLKAGRIVTEQPKPAEARTDQQAFADKVRVVFGDRENIDKTLPLLLPEQQDDVAKAEARFAKGVGFMLTNGTGTGKAQPLDARVLTPDGWRKMGDICEGDEVIGAAGTPVRVVGVYPQGIKPIYRVSFSDGAATECCDEHLWETQTLAARRSATRYPDASSAQLRVLPLSEIRQTLGAQHFTPVARASSTPLLICLSAPTRWGSFLGMPACGTSRLSSPTQIGKLQSPSPPRLGRLMMSVR